METPSCLAFSKQLLPLSALSLSLLWWGDLASNTTISWPWLTCLYNVPSLHTKTVCNECGAGSTVTWPLGLDWRLYLHLDNVAARFMVEIIPAQPRPVQCEETKHYTNCYFHWLQYKTVATQHTTLHRTVCTSQRSQHKNCCSSLLLLWRSGCGCMKSI